MAPLGVRSEKGTVERIFRLRPTTVVRNTPTVTRDNPLATYLVADRARKRAVAQRAGLRWQTVHLISRGQQTPRPSTARRIERATDGAVPALELLSYFAELDT